FPTRLFPNILPSSTSFSSPCPLSTCPIQFFFLWRIVLIKHLFSSTLFNTTSFLTLSLQFTFSIFLHNHISSASNLSIPAASNVHVSHPYNTTGHNSTFIILFFSALLNPFVKSSFLLLKAFFAIAILAFISIRLLPSSDIIDPKYLNFSTCSILCPSIDMLTTPPPSLHTTIV